MPISVQVTRGLLTQEGEQQVVSRIAKILLEEHGLAGNAFMRENVIGHLSVTEESHNYVAGKSQSLAVIEVKVPSVTFRERATQEAFVRRATDVIDELKAGSHPRSRTFASVTYAVDGTWGIGGKAHSNEDLGAEIARSASH
jgi:phenylpyruvate tautomerase PptA (4-oxalocrotonate tautomerase family)